MDMKDFAKELLSIDHNMKNHIIKDGITKIGKSLIKDFTMRVNNFNSVMELDFSEYVLFNCTIINTLYYKTFYHILQQTDFKKDAYEALIQPFLYYLEKGIYEISQGKSEEQVITTLERLLNSSMPIKIPVAYNDSM